MSINFSSLLALLEDPNEEVFAAVEPVILEQSRDFESAIMQAIEDNSDVLVHKRLLQIQRKIQCQKIGTSIVTWFHEKDGSILEFLIAIDKLYGNALQNESVLNSFVDQLKRNIWIELNNYLTPLEQINVINSILYNYYGFGTDDLGTTVFDAKTFYLSNIYNEKLGNRFSLALLYIYVCQEFDIPVQAIYLDNQELYLAYFSAVNFETQDFNICYYINPSNGSVYSQMEVINMLKNQDIEILPEQFKPLSSKNIIALFIKQMQFSYLVEHDFVMANFLKELNESIKGFLLKENDLDIFE